jgi:TetR/AcrR family transcriptional regulator, cholesterol catabolism regulator
MARAADKTPEFSTADRLVVVAAQLFRTKGYAATTTREIADQLNLQKGSLYHHIASKEDLLQQICSEAALRLQEEVAQAIADAPPEGRLSAMMRAHLLAALDDRDMHAVTLIEMRSLSEERQAEVVARRAEYLDMLVALIGDEQAAGRVRSDISARMLALALLDLLNWVIFWFQPDGPLTPEALAGVLTDIYFNGAGSRPAGSESPPAPLAVAAAPPEAGSTVSTA